MMISSSETVTWAIIVILAFLVMWVGVLTWAVNRIMQFLMRRGERKDGE